MKRHHNLGKKGFSLVELLVVVAIAALLLVAGVPAISALSRSGNTNRAISGVAGAFDLARQYAVAQNTYTWVVFAANTGSLNSGNLYITILASKDGSNTADGLTPINLDAAGTYDLSAATSNLVALQKIDSFRGARLSQLADSPVSTNPAPDLPNGNINFKLPSAPSEAVLFFNNNPQEQRVVQFSPNGQARVSGSISQLIEIGLQSVNGNRPDPNNIAAIQINGISGQTRVYRR